MFSLSPPLMDWAAGLHLIGGMIAFLVIIAGTLALFRMLRREIQSERDRATLPGSCSICRNVDPRYHCKHCGAFICRDCFVPHLESEHPNLAVSWYGIGKPDPATRFEGDK